MKYVVVSLSILLLISYSTPEFAQNKAKPRSEVPTATVSISIETGRYDPDPGCKKEVDGCFPKIWTSAPRFALGTRVWLKATLVNHSKLAAHTSVSAELPVILFNVQETRTRLAPLLTQRGCRLRQATCTLPSDDPNRGLLILSGLGYDLNIPPGSSVSVVEEVTGQYAISRSGEYIVTAESGSFDLITLANLDVTGGVIDGTAVIPSLSVKSEPVSFIVF